MPSFVLASPQEICTTLGKRLRAQRLNRGWSQQELATRAGMSVGTIRNIEHKGQATLETIVQLALILKLADDLKEVFEIKVHTIADIDRTLNTVRQRAPRKIKPRSDR
ncbi:helix-turn-helix domain-containing protein [Neisseriaceae bacterium TC5R-5]|nr:helix-turn-helix domain-containing protein [Neisseriaceae bacterium TC5R-5]